MNYIWLTTIKAYNKNGDLKSFDGPKVNAPSKAMAETYCECLCPYATVVCKLCEEKEDLLSTIQLN